MTATEALVKTQEAREQNTNKFIDRIIKETDGLVFGATSIGEYTCNANLIDRDLRYINKDRMMKELTDYYSKNGYKVNINFSTYPGINAIDINLDWSEANE